jgi:Dimethylamine methyltransferase (Dimeth_PyL)
MGGMRAAGDLVGRMQMTRGMRLTEAKEYVAGRLGVAPIELSDPVAMSDVREAFGLGRIPTFEISHPAQANAMESKFNISRLLDVPISSVEGFRQRAKLSSATVKGEVWPDRI